MSFSQLTIDHHDQTATVTLNRPDKLNSLSSELLGELFEAFDGLDRDAGVRAVVLTGSGDRAFAAGADVEEMSGMSVAEAHEYSVLGHRLGHRVEGCHFPVLAAVHGFALGGGCELALSADFIVAAENAVFGMPETTLGLMPGFGGTFRLAERVGVARARQLIYTGKKLKAREALECGLVNEMTAKGEAYSRAREIAQQIAENAPLAVAAAKRAIAVGATSDPHTAAAFEARAFASLFDSDDAKTGIAGFVAKERSVGYKGR
jgi:enoyl-CoA hydratase